MDKLDKRQIIILAVAALFALYAAYEFLIARPATKKVKAEANLVQTESFVNTLSNELMKYKVVGVDTYITKKAEMDWSRNPFWDNASYREFAGNKAGGAAAAKIIYSGYVDTGTKKMAIINGMEYEAGEALDVDGFILKKITPSRILVVNPKTGSEVYFPIQE